jgi:8-oxo-dGTP pyrophosphatase MutT (NUDIX family)
MAMPAFLERIRAAVGTERLSLPSVSVLAWDDRGRLLMVRNAAIKEWVTVGGIVEPEETPREAAIREALEETGLELELTGLRDVLGGRAYWVTYPNGDRVACMNAVFDARVTGGAMRPDGEEVDDVAWWEIGEVARAPDVNRFARAVLTDVGALTPPGTDHASPGAPSA